jgi:hypothetical protein
MGNYYPDDEDTPGFDFNPLEHPAITAAVLAAPIAAGACLEGACEALGLGAIKVAIGRLIGKTGSI